jgi:hypothetical protein
MQAAGRQPIRGAQPEQIHRNHTEHISCLGRAKPEQMIDPMTDLNAYTDEELEQEMARVLAQARGEVLNDAEVRKFWQLNEEILRRRAASGNAA